MKVKPILITLKQYEESWLYFIVHYTVIFRNFNSRTWKKANIELRDATI